MREADLIYDWNQADERWERPPFKVQLDDETLRDGLQSPSVRAPAIAEKIRILHLMERLGIDPAKVNVDGGAIALGHPLGATGARITGKAAQLLQRDGGRYAVATQCIGGGQGIATLLERAA